jgi:hypothetical protein
VDQLIRIKLRQGMVLSIIAVLIFLFGMNSTAVERFYSDGFYQIISVMLRAISAVFPFTLGDFLYAVLILYCIWSVIRVIKKTTGKGNTRMVMKLIPIQLFNFTLLLYIVFKLLWGLNYSRPSISGRLNISDKKYTTRELVQLGDFLINRVNILNQKMQDQRSRKTYTIKELENGSKTAYDKLSQINPFFTYRIPAVKPVLLSWLISKIGIEGYYCPPSGEANVNMRIPPASLPFITCHEISHELGVAREDEANLVGYLVSINSADPNFQYAGYYDILRSVLFEIRIKSPEDFAILYKKINDVTLADFKKEREFWNKYNGDMSAYMGTALDSFLKINNQKKGTDSYQDIVLWVYNLHQSEINHQNSKLLLAPVF